MNVWQKPSPPPASRSRLWRRVARALDEIARIVCARDVSVGELNARLVVKESKKGPVYAVEFEKNGRPHRTIWTNYESEARGWMSSIVQTGWSSSGRPLPSE